MAGTMNTACRDARPALAEHLMLGLPLPQTLAEHLAHCADCRREAAEITDVVRTLERSATRAAVVGGLTNTPIVPPADLRDKVHRGITQAGRVRTRRHHRIALGAAAVLTAATAIFALVVVDRQPARPVTSVALVREGPMVSQTWGTEVPVALTGLRTDQTYRLMTTDASGHTMPGGSVRLTTTGTVHTQIITAMPRDAITALLVQDGQGKIVARAPVASPTSAAA